jgi:hypothetical protein
MSSNHLESIDFLQYLTFYSLDLSFNHLKIVDIDNIHFRNDMYELSLMNFLNLSSNQIEYIKIHWDNESPHTIDLSENKIQSIELHGQTTYSLILNNNSKLSLLPSTFLINLPLLQNLYLNSIQFDSFEYLIYLYNLTNIHVLFLNNNQLQKKYQTLNWNIFYPWHKNLTHLSLKNMSIEKIYPDIYLDDYDHLLTIDFYENNLQCDCTLHPFINWLKTPPPPLTDFYEPLHKVLSVDCPPSLFDLECDDGNTKSTIYIIIFIIGISLIIILMMIKFLHCYIKRKRSKPYDRMFTDNDIMALNETNLIQKTNDDE